MIVLQNRNVNGMFYDGLQILAEQGERSPSRAGDVVVMACPVMSVYDQPTERVLFNTVRDANPMFHLMESLWMLAGRNDSEFLDKYVGNFGERFAEKGDVIHGAYGHRWRTHFGFDQIDSIVQRLRENPDDRQCVLQMWDTTPPVLAPDDMAEILHDGGNDLLGQWKDRPCNTHVYFRVRVVSDHVVLDMTVCCRSNDIVWGAYGANAVHFSVLQEYVAGRLGVRVGKMYQFSNNYHGYVDVLNKLGDPGLIDNDDLYSYDGVTPRPIGTDWDAWDDDLAAFMTWHVCMGTRLHSYKNDWFTTVAQPMAAANWNWKNGFKPSALKMAERIEADDWKAATVAWMKRRM